MGETKTMSLNLSEREMQILEGAISNEEYLT